MADASKTRTTAEKADDDQAKVADALGEPADPRPTRDDIKAGQDRELARQKAVADAVDKAGASELPKLGGTPREPGLGR